MSDRRRILDWVCSVNSGARRSGANERSGTVIAVALTSQEPRAGFPLTLQSKAVGLAKRSWIKISQIRTLAVERIGRRLGVAPAEELAWVIDGLNEIIG